MSAAQILKSMKSAPKLYKSTYNRWSSHFRDALSLFDIDDFILEVKKELDTRNSKSITETDKAIHKQDQNIRVALSQLVPDIAFHLVDSSYTSKECWDNLREFYCPNSTEDVDDLLEEFWGLTVEDDIDVDEFVQKLAEIRGKISLVDRSSTPQDKSMKKRLLGHFIKCCGGFYMSTVISLKDPSISFQAAVTSIRSSQEVYRELHPPSLVALTVGNSSSPNKMKVCAFCNRKNHVRENCFLWLDTPDGSKWAAKNPEKAAKTRTLQKRLSNGRNKRKNKDLPHKKEQEAKNESNEIQHGIWVMQDFALSSINAKNNDIVFDTGATNHIFHDKNLFCSLTPSSKSVITASGNSIPVSGIGRVRFEIFDYPTGKVSKWIEIENVWYVPSCTRNLVSGNQLLSKGLEIQSSNGSFVVLSSDGKVIATARPKGGLFCFNTKHCSYIASPNFQSEKSDILLSQGQQASVSELIHKRFAHVGVGNCDPLIKEQQFQ